MGSRAHYAVIKDGKADLHYSHWGAQYIDSDVLWGPDQVIPFVESLDLDDPEHVLLDATWSEGAVVLDVDRKKLLVSGGETIGPDPQMRRLWLRLANIAWTGWDVSWAVHGISHVVDALGIEREKVLGKLPSSTFDPTKLYACHTQGRARMLLSIRDEHGLEHYGFDAPVEYYLVAGQALIGCLDRCRLYSTTELERGVKLPEDAIFIDKTKHRLVVTLAPIFGFYDPRIATMIELHWPGWRIDMNYEGLHKHPEVSDLDFRIPDHDIKKMLKTLQAAVCISPASVPLGVRRGPSGMLNASGEGATSRHHKLVDLSQEERSKRFEALVRKLHTQV
jgi:hypothetical protein